MVVSTQRSCCHFAAVLFPSRERRAKVKRSVMAKVDKRRLFSSLFTRRKSEKEEETLLPFYQLPIRLSRSIDWLYWFDAFLSWLFRGVSFGGDFVLMSDVLLIKAMALEMDPWCNMMHDSTSFNSYFFLDFHWRPLVWRAASKSFTEEGSQSFEISEDETE